MKRWIELNPDIVSLRLCRNPVRLRNDGCPISSNILWDVLTIISNILRPVLSTQAMLQICLWSFSHTVSKEKVCSRMNSSVVWSMWHWPEESTYLAQCLLPSPSLEGFPVANAPAIISMHFMLNHQMGRSVFVRRLSKNVSAGRGMLSHKKRRMFVATDTENLWCVNSRKWRLKNISASSWKSRGCEWILKYLLMVYQWTGSLGEPGRKTAEKTRKKRANETTQKIERRCCECRSCNCLERKKSGRDWV